MPAITSTGIGSGLDIQGMVQQLVAAEGQPAEARIARQEARTQAKLSGFGTLKSSLADFRDSLDGMKDLAQFLARKATSSNEESFTVSAGSAAVPALYSVEVVELAQAQKLSSAAFADEQAVVGTGTLTIGLGDSSFSVEIDEDSNTLGGIRDAINAAGDNPGVTATLVHAESGSYLLLGSQYTGSDRTVTVTPDGGDGGLASLAYDPENGLTALTEVTPARDAHVRIDGLDVVSDGNTVAGAIDGVTVTLLAAAPGESAELRVENDVAAVRETVGNFVDAYNALVDTFDKLTAFDPESQTAAALQGDATIRGVREHIRREFGNAVDALNLPFGTLSEIGIETQLDGKLAVDDARISEVLAGDFAAVGQLFAHPDQGYATRLFDIVDGLLNSDGLIETRTAGLTDRIDRYNEQREALGERLGALETRLLRQFNALDTLVGQLSATSNFLAQQLASLPKINSSGNGG